MKSNLAEKECKACDSGTKPLKGQALRQLQNELGSDWKVVKEERLEKQFKLPDFKQALALTYKIGKIAEEQGHHPDIYLTYGEVRVQLSTHSVGGLSEADFILAAKISAIE